MKTTVPAGPLGSLAFAAVLAWGMSIPQAGAAPVVRDYGPFSVTFYNFGDTNGYYTGAGNWTEEQMADVGAAVVAWDAPVRNVQGRQIKMDVFWYEFGTTGNNKYILGGSSSCSNGDGTTGWNYGEHVWRDGANYSGGWSGWDTTILYDVTAGSASWNFGADLPTSSQIDFRSVITHEIGHSIGFDSSYDPDYDDWGNGWGTTAGPYYWAGYRGLRMWDKNLIDQNGNRPLNGGLGTPGNFDQLGDVTFTGANATAHYGGPVPVYSPDVWEGGSSLVHLAEVGISPEPLMSPYVSLGEMLRAPTALELAVMQDMGWAIPDMWQHDPNTAGAWETAGNWMPSLPTAAQDAIIDNGGTAVISTGGNSVRNAIVGETLAGSVTQSGGVAAVAGTLSLGGGTGAQGAYALTAGSLASQHQVVGSAGRGTFTQSGGTNAVGNYLYLGSNASGAGTYTLAGGSLASQYEHVGYAGRGSFVQSGGTNVVGELLSVGYSTGSAGTYALTGGSVAVGGSVDLGGGAAARGVLTIAGGSLTAVGPIVLARGNGATGELAVSKGAYVAVGGLTIYTGEDKSTRVSLELDSDGHSVIHTTAVSTLGGTINVQALSIYRPREGDVFDVIASTDPSAQYFSGNFTAFVSNITLGLPAGSSAFDGSAAGADYELVFLGFTEGDANGDHWVDGGDMALMGGGWLKTGQSWATGDFNGDGEIDGGDLALLGSNWYWHLPSPAPGEAGVPEPAALVLLSLGGAALLRKPRP